MRAIDFFFKLPEPLIAHYSMSKRSSCRLLSLDEPTGVLTHSTFTDLPDKLNLGDLLVSNNTHVIPVRLSGRKAGGGKTEVLVERMLDDKRIFAHTRASKAPKPGAELLLSDDESINVTMTTRHDVLFEVESNDQHSVLDVLNNIGHMLLPPRIDRPGEDADRELYQAVYSGEPGAVTVSTTGLHFDEPLLEKLHIRGMEIAFVTLHVGAGTSQPVRVDTTEDHIIYSEYVEVPQDMVDAVLVVKARSNRVIAVDTTLVRSLESAAQAAKNDLIEPPFDDTQIFIYPGFQYKVIDALMTNSHLPESMLVMLVSALTGYQHTMNAYKATVEEKYRFSNYDDAMFITYNPQVANERVGK